MQILTKIVLAFCLVILSACSGNSEKNILGKWKKEDKLKSKTEFFDDGTLHVYNGIASTMKLKGKWSFLEDSRLKIEMSVMGITSAETFNVTFQGDTMTMIDGKDNKTVFNKDK